MIVSRERKNSAAASWCVYSGGAVLPTTVDWLNLIQSPRGRTMRIYRLPSERRPQAQLHVRGTVGSCHRQLFSSSPFSMCSLSKCMKPNCSSKFRNVCLDSFVTICFQIFTVAVGAGEGKQSGVRQCARSRGCTMVGHLRYSGCSEGGSRGWLSCGSLSASASCSASALPDCSRFNIITS